MASVYCAYSYFFLFNDSTNGSSLSNSLSAFIAARSSVRLWRRAKNGLRCCNSFFAFCSWSLMALRSAGLNCAEKFTLRLLMSFSNLLIVVVDSREISLNNCPQLSEAIRRCAANLLSSVCCLAFIRAIIDTLPCCSANARCSAYFFSIAVSCSWKV